MPVVAKGRGRFCTSKTSTGFSKAGATVADIALMRAAVGPSMGVKASGGVRTLADLRAMVAAGASRVGASASVAIVQETGTPWHGCASLRKTGRTVPRTQRPSRLSAPRSPPFRRQESLDLDTLLESLAGVSAG